MDDWSKCPWPWFGGKRHAADLIWSRLGDVEHFVDPFCGSLAVLLCRPHLANRPYHSETVNDVDGYLVNAWRAIVAAPDEVADWASWPVAEADLMARHLWLLRWAQDAQVERLRADPEWYDARAAGYWAWGQSCWIGSGWCSGRGPWRVDLETGRVVRVTGPRGVHGKLPRLGDDGVGVATMTLREPGVAGQLPHLGDNGRGVNHAGTREPGVRCECADDIAWHPMTMPKLREWLRYLSARLRHVRILNGDWHRALTNGATKSLSVRGGGHCGILLDPPYSGAARTTDIYAHDSATVAADCLQWCLDHGDDPDYRIALCGFTSEGHEVLTEHGWTEEEWYTKGFIRGGMANTAGHNDKQKQERIWFSPHCVRVADERQASLFEEE